jgi:hypothetical protein
MGHAILHYLGLTNASGLWYLLWSGIFGDVTIFGGLVVLVLRHNCHVTGCKSVLTHNDPALHAPACRKHHSLRHKRGVAQ